MAVVTKAMGAFLVLMLLLMPYYTSEPMGQKEADALEKKVEEVSKNIQSAMDKLATAGAEDLRKQLEEALRQLARGAQLITDLKRMIDQLERAGRPAREREHRTQVAGSRASERGRRPQGSGGCAAERSREPQGAGLEQLQKENAELKAQVAQLRQENEEPQSPGRPSCKRRNEELKRIVDPLKAEETPG